MFGALYAADDTRPDALLDVAREFTPRFEIHGPREITLDLTGLARLLGDAPTIAAELQRTAGDRGLVVQVAIAGTRTAARLLAVAGSRQPAVGSNSQPTACCIPPTAVVEPGTEAAVLAPLPLALLAHMTNGNDSNGPNVSNDPNDLLSTFRQWGLRTLGDIAALPSGAVAARLGKRALALQRLARGEDLQPLVPALPEERFEQALDLEWPIEGLEPLSFVLGRLMEPLSAHLERRGRGAAVLHVRLHLVTRARHERSLQLPAPVRDARTLRTLALLDLESHPPPAAVDRVVVAVDPTPGRVLQFSLLTRPLPSPEQLSTLMARLTALMGEGRCGSPVAVDSWQPGAFAIKPFAPVEMRHSVASGFSRKEPSVALRRFRRPIPVRVRVEQDTPVRVVIDRRGFAGGRVEMCAGPWRTSGNWWRGAMWDRDEWDLTLSDGATYHAYRDRNSGGWFLEGVVD